MPKQPLPPILDKDEAENMDVDALFKKLDSSQENGLSGEEAARRLEQYGANALEERHVSPLRRFLGYFWGPIPWMIEVAAVLSALVQHWSDFIIIVALLIFNAGVGFWQEYKASNAVEALKKSLALNSRVLRDGKWQQVVAQKLVPGDVIRLRLGDIIPADAKLIDGDYLSIDQSALTGESLPVDKKTGDMAYSGSVAKQGEMVAVVTGTGSNTYFGQTAQLVESAETVSHFQKAVLRIGDYLIYLSLGLVVVLMVVQLFRHAPWLELVQFALILVVASIPVAMPAVLSVTMAVGAMALSKQKAILSRLESIEEMAGMDILCSDKTGTLTQNKLKLGEPMLLEAGDEHELLLAAGLASKAEDQDAIDLAVLAGLDDEGELGNYKQTKFTPFDPVAKRTEAEIEDGKGNRYRVSKGAPQVILDLAKLAGDQRDKVGKAVDEYAQRGFRTLGVARSADGDKWSFLGVLPLFDPPREDSADTINDAEQHGVGVKMVTGDNLAIAREIAGKLSLGQKILVADEIFGDKDGAPDDQTAAQVESSDGFAQVFPEHKFNIVKALQSRDHIVGMTGDGVNDAPALKQADVGIAVSGATDAARAAADLVLTAPGLSVIVSAIEEARRIFERMNSYAIYRITETIRIMVFVVLAMLVFNFYPITAIMIILLAFFNDVPIMTIAYDNTAIDPSPVRWEMHRVILVSTVMGLTGVAGSFLMLYLAVDVLHLSTPEVQSFVFLKMAVAGHLTLFISRSKGFFLKKPYPAPIVIWSAVGTKVAATVLVAYGFSLVSPIGWGPIGLIWAYSFAWALLTDWAKLAVYRRYEYTSPRHAGFLRQIHQPSTSHAEATTRSTARRDRSGRRQSQ